MISTANGSGAAIGAVSGGAAGLLVGTGLGRAGGIAAGGIVVGALVGAAIEASAANRNAFEYIVRLDNGVTLKVYQLSDMSGFMGKTVAVDYGPPLSIAPLAPF